MPRVLNVGSINIDHVYGVEAFVKPGETVRCRSYRRSAGGKGLNQSIALAHADASVFHGGQIGVGDEWLRELLDGHGVDTAHVASVDGPSGHAVIQVNASGENAIVIHGGANQCLSLAAVTDALAAFGPEDYVLLQNEVNAVPAIIEAASQRGTGVVFNPAPMTNDTAAYPLDLIDILVLNESEARRLTGESDPDRALRRVAEMSPRAGVVLTLGKCGAIYQAGGCRVVRSAEQAEAVDTTAAGDTFIGFFLAEWTRTSDPDRALALASRAAAVCVTRHGAADAIPLLHELAVET